MRSRHTWIDRDGFIERVYMDVTRREYHGQTVDLDGAMDARINDFCDGVDQMTDRTWNRAKNEIVEKVKDRNYRKESLNKPEEKVEVQ